MLIRYYAQKTKIALREKGVEFELKLSFPKSTYLLLKREYRDHRLE